MRSCCCRVEASVYSCLTGSVPGNRIGLSPTDRIRRPEQRDIREVWPSEPRDFAPWLAANLDHLDVLELGPLTFIGVETPAPEMHRGLDILVETGDERRVAIESQFGEADHGHLTRGLAYAVGHGAAALIVIAETFGAEFVAAAAYLNHAADGLGLEAGGIGVHLVEVSVEAIDELYLPRFSVIARPSASVGPPGQGAAPQAPTPEARTATATRGAVPMVGGTSATAALGIGLGRPGSARSGPPGQGAAPQAPTPEARTATATRGAVPMVGGTSATAALGIGLGRPGSARSGPPGQGAAPQAPTPEARTATATRGAVPMVGGTSATAALGIGLGRPGSARSGPPGQGAAPQAPTPEARTATATRGAVPMVGGTSATAALGIGLGRPGSARSGPPGQGAAPQAPTPEARTATATRGAVPMVGGTSATAALGIGLGRPGSARSGPPGQGAAPQAPTPEARTAALTKALAQSGSAIRVNESNAQGQETPPSTNRGALSSSAIQSRVDTSASRGPLSRRRLHWRRVLGSALALAIVVAGAATAMTPWGERQLSPAFSRPQSPSVELYFDRESPVRQHVGKGGTRLDVRFVVRTRNSPNGRYAYQLTVVTKRTPDEIRRGVVMTTATGVAVASPSVEVPTQTGWSSVEIRLVGRPEYLRWFNATGVG